MQNHVALGRYAEQIASGILATAKGYGLTGEDKFRAKVIERLMCDFKVDLAKLGAEDGYDAGFLLERNDRLDSLLSDGVVAIENGRIVVSKEHRFLVRAVAAAFDAYLGSFGRTHSKAA